MHHAGGGDVAHQSYLLGGGGTFVVGGVLPVGRGQGHDLLAQAGAQEVAHAGKAGVAGLFDAHTKWDGAHVEHGHQPAARVAEQSI